MTPDELKELSLLLRGPERANGGIVDGLMKVAVGVCTAGEKCPGHVNMALKTAVTQQIGRVTVAFWIEIRSVSGKYSHRLGVLLPNGLSKQTCLLVVRQILCDFGEIRDRFQRGRRFASALRFEADIGNRRLKLRIFRNSIISILASHFISPGLRVALT